MDYSSFSYKETNLRFTASRPEVVKDEIVKQRALLEVYISRYPLFGLSLDPLPPLPEAPPIAVEMHRAAELVGVGPMAAVAGAFAEAAVRAVLSSSRGPGEALPEAVVENGGDIFLASRRELVVGLYAGKSSLSGRIGFKIAPEIMPLAVCSSSGTLGHSLSFGRADLATVVAGDGALADAAATLAGNLVKDERDISPALERILAVPGVAGVLIILGEKIGMAGALPPLVRLRDSEFARKITRDRRSAFTP